MSRLCTLFFPERLLAVCVVWLFEVAVSLVQAPKPGVLLLATVLLMSVKWRAQGVSGLVVLRAASTS